MANLELFAKSFLNIADNPWIIFAFSVFMFIFSKKNYCYFDLICAMFLTMMYNLILKQVFKFPLPETCPATSYGFPCGHMNFATVFYIWMITENKNLLVRSAFCFLWVMTGTFLPLVGYHYARDVILTPLFSFSFIAIYKYARFKFANDIVVTSILILSMVLLIGICAVKGTIPIDMTLIYVALFSLCVFSALFKNLSEWKLETHTKVAMLASFLLFNLLIAMQKIPLFHILSEILLIITVGSICWLRALRSRHLYPFKSHIFLSSP